MLVRQMADSDKSVACVSGQQHDFPRRQRIRSLPDPLRSLCWRPVPPTFAVPLGQPCQREQFFLIIKVY
jgi:hypothetical protein